MVDTLIHELLRQFEQIELTAVPEHAFEDSARMLLTLQR